MEEVVYLLRENVAFLEKIFFLTWVSFGYDKGVILRLEKFENPPSYVEPPYNSRPRNFSRERQSLKFITNGKKMSLKIFHHSDKSIFNLPNVFHL